jgi:hypothetical protein
MQTAAGGDDERAESAGCSIPDALHAMIVKIHPVRISQWSNWVDVVFDCKRWIGGSKVRAYSPRFLAASESGAAPQAGMERAFGPAISL